MSSLAWEMPHIEQCSCGKDHSGGKGIPAVYLGQQAYPHLRAIVQETVAGPVCLVADANTKELATQVKEALSGLIGAEFIYPEQLHAEREVVAELQERAGGTSGFVSVGSGCITDVTRLAAYRMSRPLVAVATAASMDGYLSGHSPIINAGYKQTYPAATPKVVLADVDVLKQAPVRLTRAGLGDVLGKYTALADWQLGHIFTGEYWCSGISKSVHDAVVECESAAPKLGSGQGEPAEPVMQALLTTGYAMACVGNSRPASGAEHHMSHYWEMQALQRQATPSLHGEYVAVASVVVAALYGYMLEKESLHATPAEWEEQRAYLLDDAARRQRLEIGFGSAAAGVEAATKGMDAKSFGSLSFDQLQEKWKAARASLAGKVPSSQRLVQVLRSAGAPATPGDLGLSNKDVYRGIIFARELRDRFTMLDVAAASGSLEAWAEQFAFGSGTSMPKEGTLA